MTTVAGVTGAPLTRQSARERLLAAADELFYAEGVQTVGIDRVIERAGVAKASLYNTFKSKDELVHAYLGARADRILGRIQDRVDATGTPRGRLLAVFEAQALQMVLPEYHGCAFATASAEAKPGSRVEAAVTDYRRRIRTLFTELAVAAGVADPTALAIQLHVIYDGAAQSVRLDRDPAAAAAAARTLSRITVDAALPTTDSRVPEPR